MKNTIYLVALIATLLLACKSKTDINDFIRANPDPNDPITIEIFQSEVKTILTEESEIKTIARGFTWSEGPLWIKEQKALLFSDVPENKIYKISSNGQVTTWLEPSGYTGPQEIKREGSNGLLLNKEGQLVICQHGDRRVVIMDSPLSAPSPNFIALADSWRHNKLNSPNDAAYRNGTLYFTDPPYGLPGQDNDPEKELGFSGVYRVGHEGVLVMLIDSLKRPNGIAFSPKEDIMYVSNSDPKHATWTKYMIDNNGSMKGKILFDATSLVGKVNGLPDGMKVHPSGYLFATGPGGIWIFSPHDEVSARIHIPQATSNCAFDDTFSHLFITADSTIVRVSLNSAVHK